MSLLETILATNSRLKNRTPTTHLEFQRFRTKDVYVQQPEEKHVLGDLFPHRMINITNWHYQPRWRSGVWSSNPPNSISQVGVETHKLYNDVIPSCLYL